MSRFRVIPLGAALVAAACEVAPTPREYFDHQAPAAVERRAAAEEVQDRILAMGQALNRGSVTEAMIALAPAPDAYVIAPGENDSLRGADHIGAALQAGAEGPIAIRNVEVEVGPRQNVAWFRAHMESGGGGPEGVMRLTGVYVRNEGAWQLVQAHLSRVTPPPSPPTPSPGPAADSAGGG